MTGINGRPITRLKGAFLPVEYTNFWNSASSNNSLTVAMPCRVKPVITVVATVEIAKGHINVPVSRCIARTSAMEKL